MIGELFAQAPDISGTNAIRQRTTAVRVGINDRFVGV